MEKPTVDVFTVCYNEEVVLPYFIRHYLSFCENVYIYDNYSTDRSIEITKEFDNVHVEQYDSGGEVRDDILLEIKNNCWKKSNADLVIVCDADELLYHPNIVRFLKRFKSKGYTVAKPSAYDMFSESLPSTEDQIYSEIRMANRNSFMDKMILFDPKSINEINYDPGCHNAIPEGKVKLYRYDLTLKLLHFKFMSLQYVLDRYIMYRSRLSDVNKKYKWGIQYLEEHQKSTEDHFNEMIQTAERLELA